MTRDLRRNCLNSAKTLSRTDLLIAIAISNARLLATTLDDNVSSARHEELAAATACCVWAFNMRSWSKKIKSLVYCSSSESVLTDQLLLRQYELLSSYQMQFLLVTFAALTLTECLLVLSDLSSYRRHDLELHCIHAISQSSRSFCWDRRLLLLRSAFDLLLRMLLISWLLMLWTASETIKSFLYDLNIENSFWIEVFDKMCLLFQSSWCSWSVVTAMNNWDLKWLTLVDEDVSKIEWSKLLCRLLIASR